MAQKAIDDTRVAMRGATYQSTLDKLERDIAQAELSGKLPLIKDHAAYVTQAKIVKNMITTHRELPPEPKMQDNMYDVPNSEREPQDEVRYYEQSAPVINPTIFPDRLWKTFAPILVIRHPAKQIGSYYKASRVSAGSIDSSEFEIATSYKFSRQIFDYFRKIYEERETDGTEVPDNKAQWPLVIDGDDLINDTRGIADRLCAITHLDPARVIYKWGAAEQEDWFKGFFLQTLNKSAGVVKNESPEVPSITKEARKWEQDWGPEITRRLVQSAERMMPEYEYLYQFRLR